MRHNLYTKNPKIQKRWLLVSKYCFLAMHYDNHRLSKDLDLLALF